MRMRWSTASSGSLTRQFNSEQISFFNTIKDAQKVDDLTVKIITDGPDPILLSRLYWMKMVPPSHSKDPKFAETPVGTGPYRFVRWNRGQNMVLEAKPGLLGGETGDQESDLPIRLRSRHPPGRPESRGIRRDHQPASGIQRRCPRRSTSWASNPIIILNADSGPTKDVRVRQALNYAVDKKALAEGLFEGFAQVSQGQLLSPSFFGFNKDVRPTPMTLKKPRPFSRKRAPQGPRSR
jgi:peptide/nickel transport system substrate-binding protein